MRCLPLNSQMGVSSIMAWSTRSPSQSTPSSRGAWRRSRSGARRRPCGRLTGLYGAVADEILHKPHRLAVAKPSLHLGLWLSVMIRGPP